MGGLYWAEGRCADASVQLAPGDETRPFGLAADLLGAALRGLDEAARDTVLAGAAAPARTLLCEPPARSCGGGPALLVGVTWALANRAAHSPLALSVDGAQWADAGSLRVLLRLSAWLEELPLRLTVAAGAEAAAHDLNGAALTLLRDAATASVPGDAVADRAPRLRVDLPSAGATVAVLLREARDAAAAGAPECGVPVLRAALGHPSITRAERADVLLALGAAEGAAGIATGPARLEAAAGLLEGDERARCLQALSDLQLAAGLPVAAHETLARAVAAAVDPTLARSLDATRLSVSTLDGATRQRTNDEIVRTVAATMDGPTTSGERALLAHVAWERGQAGAPSADVVALCERALGGDALLAEATCDGVVPYVVTGALTVAGAYDRVCAVLDDALEDAAGRGSVTGFVNASFCRGWPQLGRGRVLDALADLELALGAMRLSPSPYLPAARGGLAHALLEHEGPEAALAALHVDELHDAFGVNPMMLLVDVAAARALLARGDAAQALVHAERAADGYRAFGWVGTGHYDHRVAAARAHLALGDRSRAEALAREAVDVADTADVAARRSDARRALAAVLAQANGRRAVAARRRAHGLLAEAVAITAGTDSRLEHGHALAALGTHLHAAGHDADARPVLRAALDAADRMGARVLATAARRTLVAAGGRPRRARLTGADALTPAERRVADLAATGLSNREIAERLWVTVKAVEFNLSRAYAKLGVTRPGLPAALTAA